MHRVFAVCLIIAGMIAAAFLPPAEPHELGWGKGLDCSNLQLAVWNAASQKANGVPEATTQMMLQQHGSGKSHVLNELVVAVVHGAYTTNDVEEYSRDVYLNCYHANFKQKKHG